MNKVWQVGFLVALYTLLGWGLGERPWAPKPLLSPHAMGRLLRPFQELRATQPPTTVHLPAARPSAIVAKAPVGSPPKPTPRGSWHGWIHKLRKLERGQRDKVRVLHLGDSELVADGTSSMLRKTFARRFGLGGLGFVSAMLPAPWYQHDHIRHEPHRLPTSAIIYSYPFGRMKSGLYGPGGTAFDAAPGTRAKVRIAHPIKAPCTISFHYGELPYGGTIELKADHHTITKLHTARWKTRLARFQKRLSKCPDTLSLQTDKRRTRIYGWSVDYDRPGVVWSSLGVVSAQLPQLTQFHEKHLVDALAVLTPDLIIFTFGLNLAGSPFPPPPSYRAAVSQVLRVVREGLPNTACLLTGPYPVGSPDETGQNSAAHTSQIINDYQSDAAAANDCTFYHRHDLAGGASKPNRWVVHRPKLLTGDYQHLTLEGSDRMGRAIAARLLAEFDETDPDPRAGFDLERQVKGP